ncbi:MAG: FAD-dependent oxidoreductase [Sphingomonadaceae bacterium]
MLDARTDQVAERLTARIAIIGAGAAGLTLAERLSRRMDGVLLVESGGMAIDGATQALAAGRSLGVRYFDLLSTRLRLYGGTTNHWTGFCRVHSPIDFEGRPELGVLPWPVRRADMEPYLRAAAELFGIDSRFDDQAAIVASRGLDPAQLIERHPDFSGAIVTRSFQLTERLKLGEVLGDTLAARPGLTQVLNLNAVEVVPGNGRRIAFVRARTTTGKEVEIRADTFVLACHGIENARKLLNSTARAPEGVGNATGNVGRHFSEHGAFVHSTMIPAAGFREVYDYDLATSRRLDVHLALPAETMRANGVLNYYCRLVPRYSEPGVHQAMDRLWKSFLEPFRPAMLADMRTVLSDLPGAVNEAFGKLRPQWQRPSFYLLRHRFEQAPNPDSRVVLSSRRNALGQREADLDWQFRDLDLRTVEVGIDTAIRELSALGFGRVAKEPLSRAVLEARVNGTHHQMGTTRMSADPKDGVVDGNGRVHEHDNLYIAGSSVFPNPGDGGPTIMLVAMAMRLADHLAGQHA